MNEENPKQEGEKSTKENSGIRNQSATTSLIESANAAAERLEAALNKQAELLSRQEELAVRQSLGGKSSAGQEEVKKELTPKEYKDLILQGKNPNDTN